MPNDIVPIVFPIRGISDGSPASEQPVGTTRESVNMRGVDPRTGNLRGATRQGTRKFCSVVLVEPESGSSGSGSSGSFEVADAVRNLASVTYDARLTTYTALEGSSGSGGEPEIVWQRAAPSGESARRLATDRQGNVYAIAGRAEVVKFNPAGVKVAHFEVPLANNAQRVLALAIDETDAVYTAVSVSPQGATVEMFRHSIDLDRGVYRLDWKIELAGVCPALATRNGILYVLTNEPLTTLPDGIPGPVVGMATLRVYDSLDATDPRALWSKAVPFPASGLAVNESGSVFVASYPNERREANNSGLSTASVDWVPEELDAYEDRAWAWLDARDLTELVEDEEVTSWIDKTGNNRNAFFDAGYANLSGASAPLFKPQGIGDFPMVSFGGDNALTTASQQGNADDDVEANFSLQPTVNGESWTLFLLVVGVAKDDGKPEVLFQQHRGEFDLILTTNQSGAAPDEVESGALRMHSAVVSAAGSSGSSADPTEVLGGSFLTADGSGSSDDHLRRDSAVIVFRHGGDDASEASKFRINGIEIDSFTLTREQTTKVTTLGRFDATDTSGYGNADFDGFSGMIAEIICIRDNDTPITTDEIERIEGYLAHRWGLQHNLDPGHTYAASPPPSSSSASGSSASSGEMDYTPVLRSVYGIVSKYGPESGRLRWAFAGAGVGYAVEIDADGGVYSIGNVVDLSSGSDFGSSITGGNDVTARKIIDDGAAYTLGWSLDSSEYPAPEYPVGFAVDAGANVYLPVFADGETGLLTKVDEAGSIEWTLTTPGAMAYDVTPDPRVIDYDDETIKEPEHLYVCRRIDGAGSSGSSDDDLETVVKFRLVASETTQGSPRAVAYLGVVGGNIWTFAPPSTAAMPTGGEGALSADSQFYSSATLFGEVFFTDGIGPIKVYRPRTDEVVEYAPTSAGEFPPRPKLLAAWRGAIIAARFDDNPHQWFITRRGDPYNVDLFPPFQDNLQAVLGTDSRAGPCPDIINCLMVISDDLVCFGGDHSIWRLTGDPMAGGVFDLVSDQTGIAFGESWTKDPDGVVYFFGTRGAVYRMQVGVSMRDISLGFIDKRLAELDMAEVTARLVWNHDADGLDVFIVPLFQPDGEVIRHFFWERSTGAWHETEFAAAGHQVASALVIDGDDPEDRTVLIGCADGFVRCWDLEAEDDDGENIEAAVLIGPYQRGTGERYQYSGFIITLATGYAGCSWAIYGKEHPETTLTGPSGTGTLVAGRNPPIWARASGVAFWLRLSSDSDEAWAFEAGTMRVTYAGETKA